MSRATSLLALLLAAGLAVTGCVSRSGLTGLAQEQRDYYAKLGKTLKDNHQTLDSGLTLQLAADRTREQNMLEWERDLQKAEVLLDQRSESVKGRLYLLELKMAELDLAAADRLIALRTIDDARKQAILRLYDKVVEGVAALEKNNAIILGYLSSNDAKVLLRSLDLDGIFRVLGAIQQLQHELDQTSKQAQEEQQKQAQEVRQAVQRARDLLIKVYAK